MRIEPDSWLAGILGQDVYRICWSSSPFETRDSAQELRDALATTQNPSAFYYAKVPTQAVEQVRVLCSVGFFVVDVNLTYERLPQRDPDLVPRAGIVVLDLRPAIHAEVLDIARRCFTYSRFHLDPFLTWDQANQIKTEWVRNYILGRRGEQLLVAESDGVPVGFLAVLRTEVMGRSCRVIDLIGVSAAHHGRGVGESLINHFIQVSTGECALLRVGTQVANIAAARLYERCGFRLAESAYVLHAHVKNGQALP
jgi:ribosomal protein S18 acetylase RimI-like enzyme